MSDRPRVPVADLTVLLLTHPGGPVALQALDALALQDRHPSRIVLTGLDPDDPEILQTRAHPLIAQQGVDLLVREPLRDPDGGEAEPWRVVEDARADLPAEPGHWVWILHDDSQPEPSALARLIEATRRSSGVGLVGPKLVRADDPRKLVSVGHQVTRGGRVVDAHVARELDQGQHDERVDVIGVPLPGMLVRSDVLAEVGGIDRAFGDGAEGLDLSWRSHLAGYRVVVAPDAVVRQAANGHPPPTHTTRRRFRQAALARGSLWLTPWRAVGILLTSLLAGLGLLLVKRPSAAAAEFADLGAVLSPGRGLGARWRFRGRRRVRRRDLRSLFAPATTGWHGTTDTFHGALTDRRSPQAETVPETGPVSEDAESLGSAPSRFRTLWSWPLVLGVLVGVVAALVRWRDLLPALSGRSDGVRGGEVHAITARAAELWHAWADPWTGGGLGSAAESPAWLLPMTGFTWVVEQLPWVDAAASPAAVTLTWILFASVPLSVLTGYLAARTGLRSRWARSVAGLVWAGMAPLSAAVDEGRLGPVIAHVAMPLLVAGVVVAGSRREGALRTSATFATVLLAALVGLFVPVVLVLTSIGGVLVVAFGPGWGRLRGLLLAVLPWALTGPWLRQVVDDPRVLLGGAGSGAVGATEPDAWHTMLLHAGSGLSPTIWWTVPLVILALGAATRSGHRGRRASALLAGALLGLAAALAAPLVRAGVVPTGHPGAGDPVTAWPGTFLSLSAACLLLAAAQTVELPASLGRRWPRTLVTVVTGVVVVAGLGTLAWTAASGIAPSMVSADRPYPAVVEAQAEGPEALRILDLSVTDDTVTYRLEGREPGLWVRDRVGELVVAPAGADDTPGRTALADAVVTLTDVDGTSDDSTAHEALLDLAVGYVGLRADPEDPLVTTLDATAALSRVTSTDELLLWRVGGAGHEDAPVPPARVRLVDESDTPLAAVPVSGARSVLRTSTDAPGATSVVISEEAGWASVAQVRVSGEVVEPVEGEWPLRYPVSPGAARQLQVQLIPHDATWWLGTTGLLVLVAFLALPFGSPRRRSSS